MFITTANAPHNIPQPLLDRMETIHLPGYTEEDKVEIAKRHLIPKQISEHGLDPSNLTISEGAVREIIRLYTREAGVRNLERSLAAICRKVAREVVKDRDVQVNVTRRGLQKYLGFPVFVMARVRKKTKSAWPRGWLGRKLVVTCSLSR